MKNTQSKIKPIKTGKNPGTMHCLGCKDFTNNFRPQEVKMTKCSEKNQIVLFVDLMSIKIFKTKSTTTTKNNLMLYKLIL